MTTPKLGDVTPLTLGDVTVTRVIEIGRSTFPTTSMLPDSTADAIARHHHWLRPHFWDDATGDLGSRIGTYVVRTPRHTVLIVASPTAWCRWSRRARR